MSIVCVALRWSSGGKLDGLEALRVRYDYENLPSETLSTLSYI